MDYADLNFGLTDEDIQLKMAARKFATNVIKPIARELDRMTAEQAFAKDSPFWEFVRLAYKNKYHTLLIPEEYGGVGSSALQNHLIYEEFSAASIGMTTALVCSGAPFFMPVMFGNEDIIEKFTRPYCECTDGSMFGCWGITEPDHGTDMVYWAPELCDSRTRLHLTAKEDGDEYVLNGQKSAWVSAGTIATHCMVHVQLDQSQGVKGGIMAFVPCDLPGVSKGKPLEKMGLRDLNQGEIFFENVRIPKDYAFCDVDGYQDLVHMMLGVANGSVGCWATGLARQAFEDALEYARTRVQGGKPLIEHVWMQNRLFKMFCKVEASRQLSRQVMIYNSCVNPPQIQFAMASKTYCTQLAYEVCHDALQVFGSNGITKEYWAEKHFRDARMLLIMDGENEMASGEGGELLMKNYW